MASAYSLPVATGIAALFGVLSHLLYFIRGEHHTKAILMAKLLVLIPATLWVVAVHFFQLGVWHGGQFSCSLTAAYLGAMWTSMIIYRSFFHRLHHFPGPRLAKTSKLVHFLGLGRLDNFRKLTRWHQKYGNFVRIGPAELSIISPNAQIAIFGAGSPCLKSPWYDYAYGQPLFSLHSTRDVAVHESRRRIWDRGFSIKALRDYEGRIIKYTSELMVQISAHAGKSMVASTWFNYYSFDIMGDLAFGKSFDMLKSGKTHFAMELLQQGMLPLGILGPIPWAIPIMANAPILGAGFRRFFKWCADQVEARRKMKVEVPDITTWLIKDPKGDRLWLDGDARLIIVAGSDTTAIAMTHLFYYLASFPQQVEKLRAELKTLISPDKPFCVKDVQYGEHLNSLINETLRMHPPVPSGTFRTTPGEGITIDGVFIPGNINVSVPHYAIGRSEECYASPNEFIPERWYSRTELVKNKNAFAPFSLGPFGCIGKQVALMELRTVAALLITRFDVRLAPGEDGTALIKESQDSFTLRMGDLHLVFEERGAEKDVGADKDPRQVEM